MKKSMLLVMTLVLTVILAACGNNSNNNTNNGAAANTPEASASSTPEATPTPEALSGSVLATGSSALQPLVDQVAQKFMAKDEYKQISVQVQAGGSGTGLTQVSEGQSDIGNSDIFAEEKFKDADASKASELVDHIVGVVAMAAVVHPEVGVDNLTKQQLIDIFTGKITNWKDLGGKDQAIVIVNRPSSSGTRATFENYALGQKTEDLKGSIQEDASGTVKKLVSETPGAIGYLALSYLDNTVKTVKYEGVEPTVDNVTTGKYPVWAYEHMYTKGEPTPVVKAFLDYMVSDEVQNGDVTELGYIPATAMKIQRDAAGNVTNK
ncbi:phosphate ABC transporter substrate-binding protein [Paenibacillus protaetiae]|uniref:Phosphate-binding protein n=1 Tax=Paenibacillus protaetiae TaxID=2509456 RepID=A0A4P6F816_9BACL|nr:phosphate ABC transporter substrate-binding protein [Paenibacillus protaetiae]QAY66578.1 phosphate ABC transporter substrate-binding protein [Paenibacillus protaetiae]